MTDSTNTPSHLIMSQAARFLGIDSMTLRRRVDAMKIPTATFHGKVMVAVEDLKRAKNPRHPGRPRKPAPPTTPAN